MQQNQIYHFYWFKWKVLNLFYLFWDKIFSLFYYTNTKLINSCKLQKVWKYDWSEVKISCHILCNLEIIICSIFDKKNCKNKFDIRYINNLVFKN